MFVLTDAVALKSGRKARHVHGVSGLRKTLQSYVFDKV